MIEGLFGNKSVEKILFFLLINGKCYAAKLSDHFKTALTPIQQGLSKLEKLGILISYVENKTRYFEFDSNYPLLLELEAFLRKAYSLLDAEGKALYYDRDMKRKRTIKSFLHHDSYFPYGEGVILNTWHKLSTINNLTFSATSQGSQNSGWNGIGRGNVQVKQQDSTVITFYETGSWTSKEGREFSFSNVFRWSLDCVKNWIMLEHLRFGEQNPVFLFHLAPVDKDTLESVHSHICKEDTYLGRVKCSDRFIRLNWRVIGPKKNETIDYMYM